MIGSMTLIEQIIWANAYSQSIRENAINLTAADHARGGQQ